jgi:hypothetical protein
MVSAFESGLVPKLADRPGAPFGQAVSQDAGVTTALTSALLGARLAVGREQHDAAVQREGVHFDVEAGAVLVREGEADSRPGSGFLAVLAVELADGAGVEARDGCAA